MRYLEDNNVDRATSAISRLAERMGVDVDTSNPGQALDSISDMISEQREVWGTVGNSTVTARPSKPSSTRTGGSSTRPSGYAVSKRHSRPTRQTRGS